MPNQFHWSINAIPPFRRMMIFADGENLVQRFQAMVKAGHIPRENLDCHIRDIVVWHSSFSHCIRMEEVLRATYYTSVTGDDQKVRNVQEQIRTLTFHTHKNSALPATLTPCVFKKPKNSDKGKGVDIAMTVDILTHVHRNNIDTVLLLTGDGDFIPLVNEIQRSGKQCYISGFSDGMHRNLSLVADRYYCLDHTTFITPANSN